MLKGNVTKLQMVNIISLTLMTAFRLNAVLIFLLLLTSLKTRSIRGRFTARFEIEAGRHSSSLAATDEAISHHTHEQGNGVGNNHVVLKHAAGFHLRLEGDLYLRVGV